MKSKSQCLEKNLTKLFCGVLLVVGTGLKAEKVIFRSDAEAPDAAKEWTGGIEVVSEKDYPGKKCFQSTSFRLLRSSKAIEIDPKKTYEISGWFKSSGKKFSLIYFGFVTLDEKNIPIYPQHIYTMPDTETTLVESCRKSDTVLKVADAKNWKADKHSCVAFNIDDSGKYADLPNRNLSSRGIAKVENKDSCWEIQLNTPCEQAYPKGTKIRVHRAGAVWMYSGASRKTVPDNWTKYSGKVKGMNINTDSNEKWRRGTKKIRVVIFANFYQKGNDYILKFKNIKIKELGK